MKSDKPQHNSGKTRFNRGKAQGESWLARRESARKNGTWSSAPSNKSGFGFDGGKPAHVK
jgi:hypothetical protein